AGDAAKHVGLAGRQMELAHPDIDPHVAGAGIEKRIARETKAGDVVVRRKVLIADADVDVAEIDDVSEILRGPVVLFFRHGALPPDVALQDRRSVEVIDAGGQWIMPGLIDAHCHVSYGYPVIKGEGKGKGTTRPEFSTLKSARSVQKVLRSGVTSISVPGGTWFTDVGVRDAIKLGLMAGPRMYVAGRMIVSYGCIEDDEPSWEGKPDHSVGKLCN